MTKWLCLLNGYCIQFDKVELIYHDTSEFAEGYYSYLLYNGINYDFLELPHKVLITKDYMYELREADLIHIHEKAINKITRSKSYLIDIYDISDIILNELVMEKKAELNGSYTEE